MKQHKNSYKKIYDTTTVLKCNVIPDIMHILKAKEK